MTCLASCLLACLPTYQSAYERNNTPQIRCNAITQNIEYVQYKKCTCCPLDTQNGGRGGRAEGGGGGWERHKYLREFKRKPNTEEEGKRRRGGENDIGMADSNTRD